MNMQDLPSSTVEELLRSGRLSDSVILLKDEVDATNSAAPTRLRAPADRRNDQPDGDGSGDSSAEGDDAVQHYLEMENAARVALCVARSYDDLCRLSEVGPYDDGHNLSGVQLGDFVVNLGRDDASTEEAGDDEEEGRQQQQQDLRPGFFSRLNGMNDDDYRDYLQTIQKAPTKKKTRRRKRTIKEQLIKASMAADNILNSSADAGGAPSSGSPSENLGSKNPPRYKAYPGWVLHGIDNLTPDSVDGPSGRNEENAVLFPLQILGKLLYSVFENCNKNPSGRTDQQMPTANGNNSCTFDEVVVVDDDDCNMPSFQRLRVTEESALTRQIKERNFPPSIFRLLSDMMDINPGGGAAGRPISSFGDVIQDLEQMVSRPQTYLHNDSYSPAFGLKYYGREDEVATLREVANRMSNENSERDDEKKTNAGVEAVFVSGVAGCGKSHLVSSVGETLSSLGWILLKSKFQRGLEHTSNMIVMAMFNNLIDLLIKMRESGVPADAAYSERASKSMMDAVGQDRLSSLIGFLPSLPSLFDCLTGDDLRENASAKKLDWIMIQSVSTILQAMLDPGDRYIMICCDDLQWADKAALSLIKEILINIGFQTTSRRLLFVGLYRGNAIDDDHPLPLHLSYLHMSSCINVTEIELHNLTKEAVVDMISTEFRLTRRHVVELADVVYRKTSGHAFFVTELLNSLLRDSTISYNVQSLRYSWDQDAVSMLQTSESVAELIASNISHLSPDCQRKLCILSSFGIQTDLPLLQLLEKFHEGIVASLDFFIERGILDRAGGYIVVFCHDLILQSVYESMPTAEREKLHYDLGMLLADAHQKMESQEGQLRESDQLFFSGRSMTASLISLACDQINQINFAEPNSISDEGKQQFALLNLRAGDYSSQQGNFSSALHYYLKGLSLLGEECWSSNTSRLSLSLHEGAVSAAYALDESDQVSRFADEVVKNVPFEDSLEVQSYALRSLSHSGTHHGECISKGIAILRQLNFDILSPEPQNVTNAMTQVDVIASEFSMHQLTDLCERPVDKWMYFAAKIFEAVTGSCIESGSPYLQIIACAIINYSLQHGNLPMEAATAFATFGMLKISRDDDYASGRYWGDVVRAVIEKHRILSNSKVDTNMGSMLILHLTVDIWFKPAREISRDLLEYHHCALRSGQIDDAMISLQMACRYSIHGGDRLALLSASAMKCLQLAAKHSQNFARFMAVNNLLLSELTGKAEDWFGVLNGSISSLDDLQTAAEDSKNVLFLHDIHCHKLFMAYWKGDYISAETCSRNADRCFPASSLPRLLLIYHTFYRGLVAFRLFRQFGAEGTGIDDDLASKQELRFNEGNESIHKMNTWAQNCVAVFENKLLLLKAEFAASIDGEDAEELYKASIEAAGDNIHEIALACELLGNYYASCGRADDAKGSFNNAFVYYTQWGADAIAKRLSDRHHHLNLESNHDTDEKAACKRPR